MSLLWTRTDNNIASMLNPLNLLKANSSFKVLVVYCCNWHRIDALMLGKTSIDVHGHAIEFIRFQ